MKKNTSIYLRLRRQENGNKFQEIKQFMRYLHEKLNIRQLERKRNL